METMKQNSVYGAVGDAIQDRFGVPGYLQWVLWRMLAEEAEERGWPTVMRMIEERIGIKAETMWNRLGNAERITVRDMSNISRALDRRMEFDVEKRP